MKVQKIIFLDFDGVITTLKSKYALDKEKCDLIQHIIDSTGAKIVISSSWRKYNLELTKDYLKKTSHYVPFTPSWIDDIIGVTIRGYQYITGIDYLSIPRGVEIDQWIVSNIYNTNDKFNYVIIDDDTDMLLKHRKHFIKTNTYKGITPKQTELAIKILNNKDLWE